MLNLVFSVIRKKEPGNSSLMDFLAMFIMIIFIAITVIFFGNIVEFIDKKNDVDNLAREYILKMESTAGLTDVDYACLVAELNNLGITDFDLGGTTFYSDSIKNGDSIYFILQYKVSYKNMIINQMLNFTTESVDKYVTITKASVSLK